MILSNIKYPSCSYCEMALGVFSFKAIKKKVFGCIVTGLIIETFFIHVEAKYYQNF